MFQTLKIKKNICRIIYISKKYMDDPKALSLLFFFYLLEFLLDFVFHYIRFFITVFDVMFKVFWVFFVSNFVLESLKIL